MERGSGILMPISSLPSKYGIGTLGRAAYKFIDFLENSGQKYWQILPISHTGYGNSPYQSYSAFAGNPYFVDLELLSESGGLCPDAYGGLDWGSNPEYIDYDKLFENRFKVLRAAYKADYADIKDELDEFSRQEKWVEDYALFMALKFENGLKPYWLWEDDIKLRKDYALNEARSRLFDEINLFIYIQYRFFEQWKNMKEYANSKGISIIGDIPIYVAEDSADAWANASLLLLDEKSRRPAAVAGCPPDYFSPKGQLWGNPLYNWEYLKATSYDWWVDRIKSMLKLCDIIRIDHFRAFSAYYSIPFGDEDATGGKWVKGPGKEFFDVVKERLGGDVPLIAEDLGTLDDDVRELLKYTGFPGMKVLQFAFDTSEESDYLPYKYNRNCVVYIGTHDNDTLCGWLKTEPPENIEFAKKYFGISKGENRVWGFIQGMMSTVADVAIVTVQDILELGSSARMNIPSKPDGNWSWRLINFELLHKGISERLRDISRLYGR